MSRPFRHAMYGARWSRRNRWGLLVLPFALVAALAASSDRVPLLWWGEGLHRPTTGAAGDWVEFRNTYSDSDGEHERRVGVKLDGVSPATVPWAGGLGGTDGRLAVPPGSRALAVALSFRADPRVPVSVCRLALRDAEGNRYDYLPSFGGMGQPNSPCVPPDTPGPLPAMGEMRLGSEGDPRPATWTTQPVVVVPAGVDVTEVVVWWELPGYLALSV